MGLYFGLGVHAEDFAQDAIIKILDGRRASYKELLIDYWREHYGRLGKKLALPIQSQEIPDDRNPDLMDRNFFKPLIKLEYDHFITELTGRERIVLILLHKWGFTHEEIAEVLDLKLDSMHQLHSQMMKNILNKFS